MATPSTQKTPMTPTPPTIPSKISHKTAWIIGGVVLIVILLLVAVRVYRQRHQQSNTLGSRVENIVNTTNTTQSNTTSNTAPASNTSNTTKNTSNTANGAPAAPQLAPGNHTLSLTQGNTKRTYLVHVPSSYKGAATPLVFNFHGSDSSGAGQQNNSHMNTTADTNNFVVAYPEGINKNWNDGRAYTAQKTNNADDVAFVKAMIADLKKQLNIDAKRIYATGMSNGGMFTHRLACEMTQTFAAIAPVSASFPTELKNACNPSGSIPAIIMHGTEDPILPFNGGSLGVFIGRGQVLPETETVQYWVAQNGDSKTATVTNFANTAPNDGTTIVRSTYEGNAEVQFFQINGGGHTWPGGLQYAPITTIGRVSRDMDASTVIWDFFKKHTR